MEATIMGYIGVIGFRSVLSASQLAGLHSAITTTIIYASLHQAWPKVSMTQALHADLRCSEDAFKKFGGLLLGLGSKRATARPAGAVARHHPSCPRDRDVQVYPQSCMEHASKANRRPYPAHTTATKRQERTPR